MGGVLTTLLGFLWGGKEYKIVMVRCSIVATMHAMLWAA